MNTDTLAEFLNNQLSYVEQLDNILDVEKQALVDRDHETIEAIAQQKKSLFLKLSEVDKAIGQLLDQQALPDTFHPLKQKIIDKILTCQQKNQQNGRAIELSINSINRLQRSILKKRAGHSMTYNAKGKTGGSTSSKGYVSA